MSAKYITVAGQQYNKKQYGKRWSGIVAGYETRTTLSPGDTAFFTESVSGIPRFAKIMARGRVTFRAVQHTFNGRKVKGIAMITPGSGIEVWVGKQFVMKSLFPPVNRPDPAKENRRRVLRALRNIVEPQIQQYRKRFTGKSVIKSSLTGKPIFGAYHVDHVYPFIRLVEEWCRENGYNLETMPVKTRGIDCLLDSIDMAESWFDYHAMHAEFQVLDPLENISKGSRYFGRGEQQVE